MASLLSRAFFRLHSAKNNIVRSLCTISTAQQPALPRKANKQLTEHRKKAIRTSNSSLDQNKISLVECLARERETRLSKESEKRWVKEDSKETTQVVIKDQVEACSRGAEQGEGKELKTEGVVEVKSSKDGKQNVIAENKPAGPHSHEKETEMNVKKVIKKDKGKQPKKEPVEAQKGLSQKKEQAVVVKKEPTEACPHGKEAEKVKQGGTQKKATNAKGQSVELSTAEEIQDRNRSRLYYSKRDGTSFSLPAAIVTDDSETRELVAYAINTVGVSDKHRKLFSVNPSILGVTQSEVNNVFTKLCKAGFKKEEAAIVLPLYPPASKPDFSTIYKVLLALKM